MRTCSVHIMEHYYTMVNILRFEHNDELRRFLIDAAYMFYKTDLDGKNE